MGCGVSQEAPPDLHQQEYFKPAPNGVGSMPPQAADDRTLVVMTSKDTITVVTSPSLVRSAPSQLVEEVQVSVNEEATDKPKTGEEGAFELPEGDFEDGMLGISGLLTGKVFPQEEDSIQALRTTLALEEHFCDEDFPADNSTIFFSERTDADIAWRRPFELVDEPQLFIDGASRRDVVQGCLGDCWFLSSCAAVARKSKLIERVVPPEQPLFGDGYTGLVVCHFWRCVGLGVVDRVASNDRGLPTKDGRLMFAPHAEHEREFWVGLVEKAYAKLHGTYEALEGGQSMDAMVDLTGGLAERYDMEDTENLKKLYTHLLKSSRNGAFITCSRKGDWRNATKADEHGLVEGHAYTVSGVARVKHEEHGPVNLIRVRNPWASGDEWNGKWSDTDSLWSGVPEEQRQKLGVNSLSDGEFWMSYDDFCEQFEEVSVCTIGPDFDNDGTVDHVGQVKAIKGEWVSGETAGGSRNDFEKFATNPQFLLTVEEPDDDDDDGCSVLIGVMQEHRRSNRSIGVKMLQIAFFLYKTDDPDRRLPVTHFYYNYEDGTSGTYINFREVLLRADLVPGHYVIIPATFLPDSPGYFMVRVYSPKPFQLKNLPD
ncbi:LOW QUALITY PROTEIN: calpain-A-like [Penaeus monodon]|uniref:LOW QUALITY PROTEIN: calpain-A-like n=1 Tax=Penaeus monodon TaxID=6687 RepID=UPI0018A7ADD0|nr:LOW QUALITY PROTEIN: calpain-A-like [Penaeus monodon]